jgi:hypothetical protein
VIGGIITSGSTSRSSVRLRPPREMDVISNTRSDKIIQYRTILYPPDTTKNEMLLWLCDACKAAKLHSPIVQICIPTYNPTCPSYGWKQKLGPKRFSRSLAGRVTEIFSHTDPQTVPLVSKIDSLKETGIQVLRGFL